MLRLLIVCRRWGLIGLCCEFLICEGSKEGRWLMMGSGRRIVGMSGCVLLRLVLGELLIYF